MNIDYLYLPGTSPLRNKICAFDLDGTLIVYKDGTDPKRYPSESNDYVFLGNIKEKLIELNREYCIFIITNQMNISEAKFQMIQLVVNDLDRIPHVLIAHRKNNYRKPNPTFLTVLTQLVQNQIDVKNSYYCGDAIGKEDPFIPYQWGEDDKNFALAMGFNFVRPIDLFGKAYFSPYHNGKLIYDLILTMGTPGSGKTYVSKDLEKNFGYVRFSQDETGTLTKITSVIIETLKIRPCVLDATFASYQNRKYWIDIAKSLNKTCCILWFIRDGRPFNSLRENPITHFAYSNYKKTFIDPSNDGVDVIKMY